MITLRTDAIRVVVDDEQGATITGVFDADGRNALAHYDWETPAPPSRGLGYGDDDQDFHAGFRGGWQETFPNAGLPSVIDGVRLPFHGEAATSRWTVDEVASTSCRMHVPARLPLVLHRTMRLDPERPVLYLEGAVENVGAVPAQFVWGHHPAFPATAGARIDYPAGARIRPDADRTGGVALDAVTWPDAQTPDGAVDLSVIPDADIHQLFYVDRLAEGWAAVRQPAGGVSVGLAWDAEVHPYSWLWIQRGDPGFPFYGRARMMAVEAQTAWPYDGLAGARRRNMAHLLQPGERLTSWYTISLFEDAGSPVTGVARDGSLTFGGDR